MRPSTRSGAWLASVLLLAALLPRPALASDVSKRGTSAAEPSDQKTQTAGWRRSIAYTVDRSGPNHVYLSALSGRQRVRLTKGRDPAWSPHGDRLTYRTGNPQHGGGIPTKTHVIRTDGTHSRVYEPRGVYGEASGEAGPIVWSPSGRWLA